MKKLGIGLGLFSFLITCLFIQTPRLLVAADKYPSRPIKFIVMVSAGGGIDLVCRKLASIAEKSLGQELMFDYKIGGGNLVGGSFLAKSKPDGYTIGCLMSTIFVSAPNFMKMDFDPLTAYTPILEIFDLDLLLVVPANSPIKTLKDFMEEGRKRQLLVAGIGGTSPDVAMLRLGSVGKINVKILPFGGLPQSVAAALGGQADAVASGGTYEYVRAGKMRVIARLNGKPKEGRFGDIPTLKELGYDVEANSFAAVAGPKGLPANIEKRLEDVFTKALHDPAMSEAFETAGYTLRYRNSTDCASYLREVYERSKKEAQELGLGLYAKDKK